LTYSIRPPRSVTITASAVASTTFDRSSICGLLPFMG